MNLFKQIRGCTVREYLVEQGVEPTELMVRRVRNRFYHGKRTDEDLLAPLQKLGASSPFRNWQTQSLSSKVSEDQKAIISAGKIR